MTTVARRVLALGVMFALASAVVIAGPPHPASADDYPGQAEIDAARAAASDLASGIDDLDSAIASLADARDEATANALLAADRYAEAEHDSEQAAATLEAANARADEADKALQAARENLAAVAQAAYRDSGSMSQMGAVVGAETVDEVIARTEAYSRGSDEMDMRVQEVKAAELVASTMRGYAEDAAVAAEEARVTAETRLAEAEDAQAHAEEAVATAEQTREEAILRLSQLRGVTVELERQRQEGLEAERQEQERLQAEREQAEAEREWEQSNPQPTTSSTSTPRPTTSSTSTPRPTTSSTSTPRPTETSTPEPTTTTPAPQPTETKEPEPEPEKPATGGWSSTAAQGVTAANSALTLVGAEYQLGGSGPKYDCSGVTSTAWSAAGLWITRSSRSQYQATTHLPYSQIRPGDLVFYATDTSDPSTIFHVAIYVGNGTVMEAVNYSKPAGTRGLYAWMSGSMMPYIGRP